jgi:hypothetical protein
VTNGIVEIVSIFFSFLALAWAILFFWKDRKTAGFALLVAFILSFSAVLNQRIVFFRRPNWIDRGALRKVIDGAEMRTDCWAKLRKEKGGE